MIRTPFMAPNANAHAGRVVRTRREEVLGLAAHPPPAPPQVDLRERGDHCNRERPHGALELRAPELRPKVPPIRPQHQTRIMRRDRLDGDHP